MSLKMACMLSHFSRVRLFAIAWGAASVHGILQARILEWVAMPSPGDLPDPGIKLASLKSPVVKLVPYHKCHQGSPSLKVLH